MAEPLIKQVQYLKENGFTEKQANTLIYFHKDRIESEMATKNDLEKSQLAFKKDIEQLRSELKKDIEQLRSELKKDIEQLRLEFKKDIELIRKDMKVLKKDIIFQLGSVIVAGVLILSFLIKL